MAKKKAAKKTAAKKPPARAAKKAAPKKTVKPRKSGEQLELIKGVRYSDLDAVCREVGGHIDDMNEARRNKEIALQRGLLAMRKNNVTGYNFAGVTLTRAAGAEKITAKKDKSEGTSAGGALNQPAEPDGEAGEGQDAGKIAESLTERNDDDQD